MLFLITAVLLENGPWNKASPPIVVTLGCCRRVCLCARVCVCGGVGYSCNDDPAELEVCARPPVSHRSVFLPLSSLRSMCTLRTRKAVFWWWGWGKRARLGESVGKACFHSSLFILRLLHERSSFAAVYTPDKLPSPPLKPEMCLHQQLHRPRQHVLSQFFMDSPPVCNNVLPTGLIIGTLAGGRKAHVGKEASWTPLWTEGVATQPGPGVWSASHCAFQALLF